jgi:hypothetical protein
MFVLFNLKVDDVKKTSTLIKEGSDERKEFREEFLFFIYDLGFTIYDFLCEPQRNSQRRVISLPKGCLWQKIREEKQRTAKKGLGLWIPDQVRNALESAKAFLCKQESRTRFHYEDLRFSLRTSV